MEVQRIRVEDIHPADYNPRIALKKGSFMYKALDGSIDKFGMVVPLIVNKRTGTLISGHQRLNVLIARGEEYVDCVVLDIEEDEEKALCIALNKLGGEWDYGKLSDILDELRAADYDIGVTGFSTAEVDDLLGELQTADEEPEDLPEEPEDVVVLIGIYKFTVTAAEYEEIIGSIREKVGFSKIQMYAEIKRRVFDEG